MWPFRPNLRSVQHYTHSILVCTTSLRAVQIRRRGPRPSALKGRVSEKLYTCSKTMTKCTGKVFLLLLKVISGIMHCPGTSTFFIILAVMETWFWLLSSWRKVKVAQLCPTLCDPMDYTGHPLCPHRLYSPWNFPGRILKWVVVPFSRGSSQPKDQTQVSHTAGRFFTSWTTREAQYQISMHYFSFETAKHFISVAIGGQEELWSIWIWLKKLGH